MAATVIDALLITLGLDATNFKKGSKETNEALDKTSEKANKSNKEMEAWGKNAAASMSKLRNEVLGLLAVFTAGVGIKQFVDNTIASTASLGRLSQNLDMSAKDLAMWQLANKNAGGSVEGMTAQLKEAQQAVSDYRLGKNNAANTAFRATGLAQEDDFKSAESLLRARADAIAKITAKYGAGVGRNIAGDIGVGEDTFNLIKTGSANIDRARFATERLADAQARASIPAEEFRKKWDLVKNQFEAVGVKILTGLLPILTRLADWLSANQDQIEVWANRAVNAIEKFVEWADKAAKSVGGWKNVLIALIALNILSMVSPLLTLAASLTQVGLALGVIGGTAGTSALAVLGKLARGGSAAALALYSGDLNSGEAADLARRRAMGPTIDGPAGSSGASSKPGEFATKYGAAAARAGAALGVDPKAILGQWGLETGWGKSIIPGTNNLGNIKDFSGSGVSAKDNMTGSVDKYRSYGSVDAFADDYVSLIKRKYPKAIGAATAEEFAKALKSGGYAEDPAYVSKLARASQMTGLGPNAGARNAVGIAQAAPSSGGASGSWGPASTSTSEVNVNGDIHISTQATDAEGIAKSIRPALGKYAFASDANTGLS